MPTSRRPTRERILDASLTLFGSRGFEAVSLDEIAGDVGVTKQTVLYWFTSKDELLLAVVERSAEELRVVVEAAARHAGDGIERVDAVVRAVFRPAIRRPELLGLLRELNRLGPDVTARLVAVLGPLVERGVAFLASEMDAGRIRRADPRLAFALAYSTVVGVASDTEVLRAVGWTPDVAGVRRLRRELLGYLRSALTP